VLVAERRVAASRTQLGARNVGTADAALARGVARLPPAVRRRLAAREQQQHTETQQLSA
jgi:hypothetical protein